MEVTVILMRHQGTKLSPEQLEQATRHHGFMEIHYWTLDDGKTPRRKIKELILKPSPDATCRPLLTLTDPDQTQLKGDDMIYVGTDRARERDGDGPYLQAWWVKHDPRPVSNGVRTNDYEGTGSGICR